MKSFINGLINKVLSFNETQNLKELRNKISIGKNVQISPKAIISGEFKNIKIGSNTIIEANATIICSGPQDSLEIGNSVIIKSYSRIETYGGKIKIGDYCSVNPYTILYGHGGLTIGNHVRIAALSLIIPANHVFSDTTKYIHHQGLSKSGIKIGDDVWIGGKVSILDGCEIGIGSVVASGAVVNRSCGPYSIIAGVPAKEIGNRMSNSSKE